MSQNARQLPARSTDSGGVLDLGYVYDGNANVASITDYTTGGNQSRTLSYDTLDRLTQAVGPSFGTTTYAYNVLDDITRLTVTGGNKPRDHVYNYSAGTHQLETVNNYVGGAAVIGLLYDEQGNLKNKNGQTYDFDYGNRLRNVPGKETYRYDGHGRRVYSFTTTHAVWQYSNAGQLMYSHDNRNNRKTNYVYLQGSLLATREAPMSGGDGTYTVKYQHTDALGSPIKVTDAAGLTVETSEYEPYGHLANRALTDGPGFTGHVQDASTGMTYMQQRYYDPQVGGFLSVDPVQTNPNTGASFNRHSYASKNPYKFVDPDGRSDVNYNHTGDSFFNSTNRFDIPGMTTVTGHAWSHAFQDNREADKRGPAVSYETLKQDISNVRGPGGDKGYIYLGGCLLGMGYVPARLAKDFDTKVISSPGFIKQHVDSSGNITFYSNSRGDGSGTASWFQLTDQHGNTYGKITSITMSSDGKVTFKRNSSSVGSSVKQKAKSTSERNGQ